MIALAEAIKKRKEIGSAQKRVSRVDAKKLEAELQNRIQGEVRFDDGARSLYSTDSSNYRQIPIGVVLPSNRSDVIATVELCRKYRVPITCRGGGTSLAGQCCN